MVLGFCVAVLRFPTVVSSGSFDEVDDLEQFCCGPADPDKDEDKLRGGQRHAFGPPLFYRVSDARPQCGAGFLCVWLSQARIISTAFSALLDAVTMARGSCLMAFIQDCR